MLFKSVLLSMLATLACAAPAATTTAEAAVTIPTTPAELLDAVLDTAELLKGVDRDELVELFSHVGDQKRDASENASESHIAKRCIGGNFNRCYTIAAATCPLQCYGIPGLGSMTCANTCFNNMRVLCVNSCT